MTDEQAATVEYRDIPDWPGYRVGTDGSVWSCWRLVALGWRKGTQAVLDPSQWRRLSDSHLTEGYPTVSLRKNGKRKTWHVHQLVMATFVGPCPPGHEVAHENGIRTDCRLANLTYKTRTANQLDRVRHGTDDRGEKNTQAKLTAVAVSTIRSRYSAGGVSQRQLADEFGVNQKTVCRIVRRERWGHLDD